MKAASSGASETVEVSAVRPVGLASDGRGFTVLYPRLAYVDRGRRCDEQITIYTPVSVGGAAEPDGGRDRSSWLASCRLASASGQKAASTLTPAVAAAPNEFRSDRSQRRAA
jgi:hypothetical protein